MLLFVVVKYTALSWRIFLANMSSAFSFRLSFFLHILGVVIFYSGQFFVWTIFFKQFPMVGGWTSRDVILVYALFVFSLSLLDVFAGGMMDFAEIINAGSFDYYLTLPKPIKYILMTIIPSFFVATLPSRLVDNFSIQKLLILICACVISSLISYKIFKAGLKRYESGNMLNVRL